MHSIYPAAPADATKDAALDEALDESFPASDPPAMAGSKPAWRRWPPPLPSMR